MSSESVAFALSSMLFPISANVSVCHLKLHVSHFFSMHIKKLCFSSDMKFRSDIYEFIYEWSELKRNYLFSF